MPRSYDEESGQMLRTTRTNVIGFWQLLQEPDECKVPPLKRMQYRAYVTSGVLKLADLILQHHEAISHCILKNPKQIEEFKGEANRIKFLSVALDGNEQDQFTDEALSFAVRFLGATND